MNTDSEQTTIHYFVDEVVIELVEARLKKAESV